MIECETVIGIIRLVFIKAANDGIQGTVHYLWDEGE